MKSAASAAPAHSVSSMTPSINGGVSVRAAVMTCSALPDDWKGLAPAPTAQNTPSATATAVSPDFSTGGLARAGGEGQPLDCGLALAVERGSLLRVEAGGDGRSEELYLLATPHNRRAAQELAGSELRLDEPLPAATPVQPPNIFALYEENVGGITPLIADDLKDAEERYPPQWIEAAFREAVAMNKRSWRYIHSILKRWEAEGPDYEEAGRDPKADWLERRYDRGKSAQRTRR